MKMTMVNSGLKGLKRKTHQRERKRKREREDYQTHYFIIAKIHYTCRQSNFFVELLDMLEQ